ncbi:MAG TPA: GTPase ObgE [Anaerolineae bacterium]|nr:GTPase ObgE [Caldilineae bacterium]HID35395.1 GTPase ObgE [Anaerolineae bacterium]HIQ12692.1 GTPase ObgE [Caldilineales bacterium]
MFKDLAKIYVKGGDGGNGVVAFRREKFVPRGGPAGGSGGKGGDVYLVASPRHNTLAHFAYKVHFKAERGKHGSGSNKQGARGKDLEVPVPPGTEVYDAETSEFLGELLEPGERLLVAHGGRGGRGNYAFRSSTNQAPRIAEKGEPGEERWLRLELKLIADIGIIGVPNAGKSTLLARITRARPKIADYPFTTLAPNLGVAFIDDADVVLADIPGLIEGAHRGVGLGDDFLRHIERTRVLIHLLDGLSPDPAGDFHAINQELELFNPQLADKPQVVGFNKMDLPDVRTRWPEIRDQLADIGVEAIPISAATGENVDALLRRAVAMLKELPPPERKRALPVIRPADEDSFTIEKREEGWIVRGKRIERAAAMTNWDYYEAALRFHRIMEAMGIAQALQDAGVKDGDTVIIGNVELEWRDDFFY